VLNDESAFVIVRPCLSRRLVVGNDGVSHQCLEEKYCVRAAQSAAAAAVGS